MPIQRPVVENHAMRRGHPPGENAASVGHADRIRHPGVLKHHAASGQRIQIRRPNHLVAHEAIVVGPLLIGALSDLLRPAWGDADGLRWAILSTALVAKTSAVVFTILDEDALKELLEGVDRFCATCGEELRMISWEVDVLR